MQNLLFSLDKIIEYSNFQKLQDKMSDFFGLAIITVDFKGRPVTRHSNCSQFCSNLRNDSKFYTYCETCDSLGGIEAAQNSKPYIYLCHQGLVDIAVPILYNDIYLGAIMIGQVLLENPDDAKNLNQIKSNSPIKYCENYNALPKRSLENIKALADLIFCFCNKILSLSIEAMVKPSTFKSSKTDNIPFIRNKKDTQVLQPALSFIKNNFEKQLTLNQLADMCGITPTYFSKLFKKTTNTNFVQYLNEIRIDKAKILLLSTNEKISKIATDVGFIDCGYFIKVFKSKEGITPNIFRDKNSK